MSDKPRCFNRPDFLPGDWVKNGQPIGGKPRFRWEPMRMSTGCSMILPIGEGPSFAETMRYDCTGCRHNKT